MATIKSYTDLKQSKRLAEILPLESADMYYNSGDEYDLYFGRGLYEEIANWTCKGTSRPADIPCWSLAALLEIIKKLVGYSLQSLDTHTVFMNCELGDKPYNIETKNYDNSVDACVEMILKLHELKML